MGLEIIWVCCLEFRVPWPSRCGNKQQQGVKCRLYQQYMHLQSLRITDQLHSARNGRGKQVRELTIPLRHRP